MSSDDPRKPLLPEKSTDHVNRNLNQSLSSRKRRLRHCKSTPGCDFSFNNDIKLKEPPPLPHNVSIFGDIHPSFKRVFMLLALYLGIGTVCFFLIRNQVSGKKTNDVLDAVYFCIVTMTTVGYGDLVPDSVASKLLACVFVFTGMVLVGHILSRAADYLVEKQETLMVRAFHLRQNFGSVHITRELQTNGLRYKCYIMFAVLLVLISVGTIFLATVEKLHLVDAFYCVCSTITTLGYGDKSFSTEIGRVFAVIWILTSTICLAQFLLYMAELNTESRQRALVEWVLTRRMTNSDLEAADLDGDGVVGAAEFIIYKLKEMGKINQEDISEIMEEFEELDYDQSGTLSPSDILFAQSSQIKR